MSLSTIWASVLNFLTNAEQFLKALFSKIVREEQELIPVVEQFAEKAEAALESPAAVTIENLIPDGIGTEIASIAEEALAWIISELTAITPELVTANVATSGIPQYANPDAVAKTGFQKVSQLSADAQTHFLSGYQNMLLQKFAPAGANLSYEEAQLANSLAKVSKTQTTQPTA